MAFDSLRTKLSSTKTGTWCVAFSFLNSSDLFWPLSKLTVSTSMSKSRTRAVIKTLREGGEPVLWYSFIFDYHWMWDATSTLYEKRRTEGKAAKQWGFKGNRIETLHTFTIFLFQHFYACHFYLVMNYLQQSFVLEVIFDPKFQVSFKVSKIALE